jgi:hypothetical protein
MDLCEKIKQSNSIFPKYASITIIGKWIGETKGLKKIECR